MAINLDERVKNTEEVVIAGKTYAVAFNDKFEKEVANIGLVADKMISEANGITKEKAEEMSLEEQEKYVAKSFEKARDLMTGFFDKYLGDGEGNRIYHHFHDDTKSLSKIVGILYDAAHKENTKNQKQRRNKFLSNKR
ncbi:hypothetical protein KBX49_09095 [Liquorilactobacillus satsumensis]|uniref:hypothetical protein n=1 Tax=Liquorilactobacillus satsumensis TaxID=259059 RepID=UPI0021C3D79A|nr:hypothetical protein [Liquorilactobacillus satsumensis]MCP9357372.1 hypothetical protein [Liquorilactobacillus satsumensis]MCP9372068.1 hypothetical protein [Liquorilactobacillus satsumensis]